MAGSSSNPPLRQNYEVFLSFNGDDTRYGFTDHLYHGLVNRGIRVFRDNENLPVGQKIDELMEAITASKILVPIISTHYASSKWCLKELVQILKCSKPPHQFVLPIFYKVKPSDVREQKGTFGDEFQQFKEKYSNGIEHIELVQESEQAFEKIASLKGWESNNIADGYEGPLVKEVVRRIFNELRKPILQVPDFLVGVKHHVKVIMEMIHAESNDAKIIAIHGMGGIGKTTLAKVLYNKLFDDFDSRSFVPNIREAPSTDKGMMDLQKQVIAGVLADKSPQDISHVDGGTSIIKDIFKEKRLLLLLDDVDNEDQLNKLAVKKNWFGLETIVIITTRNKDITKATAVNLSYELNELNKDQSYKLFCKHALRGDASCLGNLEKIARDIVLKAGGLPLAIEIIGSLLYQKSEEFWSDTLDKLKRIPEGKVLDRLMLSYDALEYEQQQIFLDIACFYIPEYKYASYMWDACGFYPKVGIEKLVSLSLIKKSDEGIIIHDQLRLLGQEIVRREGRGNIGMCSRLWSKEASEVLKRKKGTPNIQALHLLMEFDLTSQHFGGIENLRFLRMTSDVRLAGDFEDPFSSILWLRWWCCYSNRIGDIMGINFNPRKLVILELLNSNITEDWKGWNQVKDLKVLILEECNDLTTTPDFCASAVGGLEELVLDECLSLKEIHPSIGKFRKTLKVLNVKGCRKLEELPKEVGEMEELRELNMGDTGVGGFPICEGRMAKLHTLILGNRKRLEYIPHTLGSLVELLKLDLRYCTRLTNIPEGIGKLRSLIHLDLGWTGVTQLPDSIGDLYNLESLLIKSTPIKCLPACIRKLSKLQHLDLEYCKKLESMPNLPCSLTHLSFDGYSMETLPDISNLTNLKHLTYQDDFGRRNRALDASEDINSFLELPLGLKQLTVSHCRTFWTFPNLSNMKNLSRLTIKDCDNFLELGGAESLTSLHIEGCRKLSKLSGVGTMVMDLRLESLDALQSLSIPSPSKKLKNLEISNCSNLVKIQGLKKVKRLETLKIKTCRSLKRISNLSHLKMLTNLELRDCEKLSNVQGIDKLTSLTNLYISQSLQDSLDLSALKKLEELEISECSNLVEVQGIEDVEGLKTLKIRMCCSLKRISNLSHLKMLTILELRDCEKLSNVEGIDKMTSLTDLYIPETLLDSLDLSALEELTKLEISECSNLVEVQGIENVKCLETSKIQMCRSLRRTTNLSHLTMLTTLKLYGCDKLSAVQDIEKPTSSTDLYSSEPLQVSLDLSALKKLEKLQISECSNLVEIKWLEDVEGLRKLIIQRCRSLERISNLSHLKMLTTLRLGGCKKLSNVQSIYKLTSLTKLYIWETLLDSLDLSAFKKLEVLLISKCSNLVEIKWPEDVVGLRILIIHRCSSLARISNLSHLKMLTALKLRGCKKLSNVQGIDKLTSLTELCISKTLLDLLDPSLLTKIEENQSDSEDKEGSESSSDELEEGEESQSDLKDKEGSEGNSNELEEGEESQSYPEGKEGSKGNSDELEEGEESQSYLEDREGSESNLDDLGWNVWLF